MQLEQGYTSCGKEEEDLWDHRELVKAASLDLPTTKFPEIEHPNMILLFIVPNSSSKYRMRTFPIIFES